MESLHRLMDITKTLRDPGGCDWDRAQDFFTMRSSLVEESYEVVEAVDREDPEALREELGDLAFLVVFYARMAEEQGLFSLKEVLEEVGDKLIRRHPHVFADQRVDGVDDILANWEQVKKEEKSSKGHTDGEGIPPIDRALPALIRAFKVQTKAARVGFDWKKNLDVLARIREEVDELEAEIPDPGSDTDPEEARKRMEGEMGDILFSVVNLARRLEIDPEIALNGSVERFRHRFNWMDREAQRDGKILPGLKETELEDLWQEAKRNTGLEAKDRD